MKRIESLTVNIWTMLSSSVHCIYLYFFFYILQWRLLVDADHTMHVICHFALTDPTTSCVVECLYISKPKQQLELLVCDAAAWFSVCNGCGLWCIWSVLVHASANSCVPFVRLQRCTQVTWTGVTLHQPVDTPGYGKRPRDGMTHKILPDWVHNKTYCSYSHGINFQTTERTVFGSQPVGKRYGLFLFICY